MGSIFSKIIRGDIPCHKLHEDNRFLSFLDIRPIRLGHALVIPKKEVDYIFDLDDELLGNIMLFSRPIAKAIERVVKCERIGIMVAGLEVPHAHVHLVPMDSINDLNFANAAAARQEELDTLAKKIRAELQSLSE